MDGIFLVDKPKDITSFDVIRQLKKQLNIQKIGHAGTLDPFATGLLIILVGKATKLSDLFLNQTKGYEATITFGSHTSTYDCTGDILETSAVIPSVEAIEKTLNTMQPYMQEPPMYSALKIDGKKLVDLARQGKEVTRKKREVYVHQYNILSMNEASLKIELLVSKGTYIRSLAVDIARQNHACAHVSQLRRTQSGEFHIRDATPLASINETHLYTLDSILHAYPSITVSDYIASKIKEGMLLDQRQYTKEEYFCVKNNQGDIIGLYEPYKEGTYKPIFTR